MVPNEMIQIIFFALFNLGIMGLEIQNRPISLKLYSIVFDCIILLETTMIKLTSSFLINL